MGVFCESIRTQKLSLPGDGSARCCKPPVSRGDHIEKAWSRMIQRSSAERHRKDSKMES